MRNINLFAIKSFYNRHLKTILRTPIVAQIIHSCADHTNKIFGSSKPLYTTIQYTK